MSLKKIITVCAVAALLATMLSGCASGRAFHTHYDVGVTMFVIDKYDMAIIELDETIRLNPKSHMAYYYRGLAHQKSGNAELAVADFEKVLSLRPNHPGAKRQIEIANRAMRPVELVFGTSVSAEFEGPSDEHNFFIRPTEAGRVTVETSGRLDTYMTAFDESNEKIGENDDGGRGNNAKISLSVEAGKTYRFRIREVDKKSGKYDIVANFRQARQGPRAVVELTPGTSVTADFDGPDDVQTFTVKTAEAGRLTVETSGRLDTFIEAFDESNNKIGENDDGGRNLNAKLSLTAEAGKTYTFKVKEVDGDPGEFEIVARLQQIRERDPVTLVLDTTVSANFEGEGDIHVYALTADSAGWVIVETTGNRDTFLEAFDESNSKLGENDDGGQGYNARYVQRVEAGKKYTFKIYELDGKNGRYQVKATFHNSEPPRPSGGDRPCGSCGGGCD